MAKRSVVVGTRSAVFAPLENLGLIIVDEEQEPSYKQEETPRYNGRDTAVYRAQLEGAVALLGSATPSLETYHNARAWKISPARTHVARRKSSRSPKSASSICAKSFAASINAAPVSETLRAAIALRLEEENSSDDAHQSSRLFLVARSAAAAARLMQCQNCSIALTYHKSRQRLECHYCGYSIRPPKSARSAKPSTCISSATAPSASRNILREQFPKARIARLDRDTVRTKREYQQVLGAFRGRRNRHSRRHADGRQGARFPARYSSWRSGCRSRARPS